MYENGADIIDIGSESTRPGSDPVPDHIQIQRLLPVINKIRKYKDYIPISVDTTSSKVSYNHSTINDHI